MPASERHRKTESDHKQHGRKNRRMSPRENLKNPRVAVIHPVGSLLQDGRLLYVDVYNRSSKGVLIKTTRRIEAGQSIYFSIYQPSKRAWNHFRGDVRWVEADPLKSDYFCLGCAAVPTTTDLPTSISSDTEQKSGPLPADYEFFRTVPFLKAIHREAVCPLLNNITYHRVRSNQRFISQGEVADGCFIVQSGTCRVLIEKNGRLHPIDAIRKGDFVGEMALLTGEPRSAHVEAETDMELWGISRELFERLIQSDPEVGTFLTEIVAERFNTRHITAERTIGKYVITDILGRGGFAIVYRGYHVDLARPVAVKMLKHDLALSPDFMNNFIREAQTIANFNNENIIKVYDIEERYRTVFIIMELLEGRSLRDVLEEVGKLTYDKALEVILQVCRGLQYAHDQGIVHQDVKPGNIFLLPYGKVKILDFGLACPCGSEGMSTGTPFYMSPEQVECLPVDERADVFALGLTLFEMLTGLRPFDADDPFTVMNLHVEQDIPDPAGYMPDIHPIFREVILKACARNPDARYRHVCQVADALQPLADQLGLPAEPGMVNKRRMSTLFLLYREDQQLQMNRLMEEFSEKAKALGVSLRAADFNDI